MEFSKSAFKHGITSERMREVLGSDYTEAFDEGFDRTGCYRVMYVGFDSQGVLLEVGVKFVGILESKYVFHANKATTYYQELFNERKQ